MNTILFNVLLLVCILWVSRMERLLESIKRNNKNTSEDKKGTAPLSILIPYHQKSKVFQQLISELKNQLDTDDEILLVYNGEAELRNSNFGEQVKVLKSETGKKRAIQLGMEKAKNAWVLSLDSDVSIQVNYLESIRAELTGSNRSLLTLPVLWEHPKTILKKLLFFEDDLLLAMALFSKKPSICYGANMLVKRNFFLQLNPYQNNWHIPTGDDMFLLQAALKKDENLVGSINQKEVAVSTKGHSTSKEVLKQRSRWASKNLHYTSKQTILDGVLSLVILLGLPLTCFALLLLGCFAQALLVFGIIFICFVLSYSVHLKMRTLFYEKEKNQVLSGISIFLFYPIYVALVAVIGFGKNLTYFFKK